MKKNYLKLLYVIALFSYCLSDAQNLVVNGDFETLLNCPDSDDQTTSTENVIVCGDSSVDYFNCSFTGIGNPSIDVAGAPTPPSGTGYIGFITGTTTTSTDVYATEFATMALSEPLLPGTTYTISMSLAVDGNTANYNLPGDCLDFGMYLFDSSNPDFDCINDPENQFTVEIASVPIPQIVVNGNNITTTEFTTFSFTYEPITIVDSIFLGAFPNANTTDTSTCPPFTLTYFYADDISITEMIASEDTDGDGVTDDVDIDDDNDGILDVDEGATSPNIPLGEILVNTNFGRIATYNLDSGETNELCDLDFDINDLSYSPIDGELYAVEAEDAIVVPLAGFYQIDLDTCTAVELGALPALGANRSPSGMSFLPDGTALVSYTLSSEIYRVTLSPFSVSLWADVGNGYRSAGDFLYANDVVYFTVDQSSGGPEQVLEIQVDTDFNFVTATNIGALDIERAFGLTLDNLCRVVVAGDDEIDIINDITTNTVDITTITNNIPNLPNILGLTSDREINGCPQITDLGTDTDTDGVFNHLDIDSDNDGISDLEESSLNAESFDPDNNGVIDNAEFTDADNDGLADSVEALFGDNIGVTPINSDSDALVNVLDLDSDDDGIPDAIEAQNTPDYSINFTNDGDVSDDDSDGDGAIDIHDGVSGHGGVFNTPQNTNTISIADYLNDDSDDDEMSDNEEGGNIVTDVSYLDPNGNINDPTIDLPNELGDTSEVAYREFLEEEDCVVVDFLEDFGTGTGRVSTPFTDYIFNATTQVNDGEYAITNTSSGLNTGWHQGMEDNTPGDVNGRAFFVNADDTVLEFYRRTIDIQPNVDYQFNAFITTMYDTDTNICPGTGIPSNVTFRIEDNAGNTIAEVDTGDIQNEGEPNWQLFAVDFNSQNNTTVQLVLINNSTDGCGNDLAIDDISLTINGTPPVIEMPDDLIACDEGEDGVEIFDLTSQIPEILNGLDSSDFEISFHTSLIDAETNNLPINTPTTYANVNNPETIYVRVQRVMSISCFSVANFDLVLNDIIGLSGNLPPVLDVCSDEPIPSLDATPTNTEIDLSQINYVWIDENGTTVSTDAVFTPTESGIFTVTLELLPCGTATFVVEVNITNPPIIVLGPDELICSGESFEIIPVSDDDLQEATFLWSTGETTETIVVNQSGTYTLTVTLGACTVSDSIDVTIAEPIEVIGRDDFTTCLSQLNTDRIINETFTANVNDANVTFEWFVNDVPQGETSNSFTTHFSDTEFSRNDQVIVTVVVTNADGCESTTSTVVSFFDLDQCIIPEGISPGTTIGFNDQLDLEFLASRTGIETIYIYNRLGTLVFEQDNYINEWEGQSNNGDTLPTATYFYVIDFDGNDPVYGNQATGWIYVNREN